MRVAWGVGITTGWDETEVFMEVSSRRLAIVQHRHPPARGLLSLISLLRAFPLTGINRNQSTCASGLNSTVEGLGRVHLRGEIRGLNSAYWASRNSPTIVSSATHSLTNPSPNTGAKPSNHVKHGCRSCKKCADMALTLIQCCPCVSCRGVLVV